MEVQLINDEFSRLASSNERPEVERPNMDAGGPIQNGEVAADESCFVETARFRVCPSTILEAKDGGYGK